MGAYRFPDGATISIREGPERTYRYRFLDGGMSGRLFAEGGRFVSGDGFSNREPIALEVTFGDAADRHGSLSWKAAGTAPATAARVDRSVPIAFESEGATMRGRLDLPGGPAPHPAVVIVHGSGKSTAGLADGDFLTAHGVAVLVYDKRGTGRSEGSYTFDFSRLARDVSAAVDFLRAHPEIDPSRIGLCGYSQGGWVAPLAASLNPAVRFVVVGYGMIESPAEEARLEMCAHLREKGADSTAVAEADPLIRAAVEIVASDFRGGWAAFESARRQSRGRAWIAQLRGTPVGDLLATPRWVARLIGPWRAPKAMSWRHDSRVILDTLDIPMVWLLGGADRSAPNQGTIAMLEELRRKGKPFETIVFPGADHGMLLFRDEAGRRIYTGYHHDYYRSEVEAVLRLSAAAHADR
jgi:dienelactone hydrolase